MKVPIRYTPVSWGSPLATLASMEDVMSNMGGVSAFTSSEDLLQEELEEWEPGETPPSPPPSTPPPPDPHLHQKVEPLRMAVLTNVNPQQTLTDSDDDLQNPQLPQPPNLHGKVRGLLSGMKKVVLRVKNPQGVQGGASTLVLQSPVPAPAPAPTPGGIRAPAPAPAPSPAPR